MFPFNKIRQVYAAELKHHANFINYKPNAELKYQVYTTPVHTFKNYLMKFKISILSQYDASNSAAMKLSQLESTFHIIN